MRTPLARRSERRTVRRARGLIGEEIRRHVAELPHDASYRAGLIAAAHILDTHLEDL